MAKDNTALHALAILADTFSGAYQANVKSETNLKIAQLDRQAKDEANQAKIFEYLIDKTDKDIVKTETELGKYQDMYQTATGSLYKLNEYDSSGNVDKVLQGNYKNTLDTLSMIAEAKRDEKNVLQSNLDDIKQDIVNIGTVQNFYQGMGHDYSAGDPMKWDAEDFSDDKLKAYMSQFPELKDVESEPFMEGLMARQKAGIDTTIVGLNEALKKAQLDDLKIANQKMTNIANQRKLNKEDYSELSTKLSRIGSMGPRARYLNTNLVDPIITGLASTNKDEKEKAENDMISVGKIIAGPKVVLFDEKYKEIGQSLVKSVGDYVGETVSEFGLNNIGYIESLSEIHNYITLYSDLKDQGEISDLDYNSYINNIETYIGPIEQFMKDFPLIEETYENLNSGPIFDAISELTATTSGNTTTAGSLPEVNDMSDDMDATDTFIFNNYNDEEPYIFGSEYENIDEVEPEGDTRIDIPESTTNPALNALNFLEAIQTSDKNLLAGKLGPYDLPDWQESFISTPNLYESMLIKPDLEHKLTEFSPKFLGGGEYDEKEGSLSIDVDNANMADIRDAQDELMTIASNAIKEMAGNEYRNVDNFIKEEFKNYLKENNITDIKPGDYKYFYGKMVDKNNKVNKIEDMNLYRLYPDWAFKGAKGNVRWITPIWELDRKSGEAVGGYVKYAKTMDEFKRYLIERVM